MELIKVVNGELQLEQSIGARLAAFERKAKQIKEQEEKLKALILAEMEENGIIKLDNDDLTISYIMPTERESFDSKAFRQDYPELYDEYIKMSPVKSQIRIKVK